MCFFFLKQWEKYWDWQQKENINNPKQTLYHKKQENKLEKVLIRIRLRSKHSIIKGMV